MRTAFPLMRLGWSSMSISVQTVTSSSGAMSSMRRTGLEKFSKCCRRFALLAVSS